MKNTTLAAIRTDRGLTAAHPGAGLLTCAPGTGDVKRSTAPMSFVAAYVADQESHPPRGSSPA